MARSKSKSYRSLSKKKCAKSPGKTWRKSVGCVKKSKKSKRSKSKRKSPKRKSKKRSIGTRSYGRCRGRSPLSCISQPNCTFQNGICRRRRNIAAPRFGPALPFDMVGPV